MSVYSRMMKGSRSLGSTPSSFELGYALGNAYGDMWASNAKKRNEAQMDEVVKQYMDDQRMQQLANPIEEKPLMTEAINGNYVSDNQNGINNNISGIGKFNRNYGLATPQNIIDEAKRRGVHQEVIDERMKGVREQIASKAKSQYMPQINQLIYGSMDGNGNYVAPTQADYLKASGLIDDYRKYDTVGADKLTETLNNRQLGQLQHLASRQQTLDDYRFRRANGMVDGRPQYRISDNAYNSALKANQDLISLGVKLTPEQQEFYDANAQVVNAWRAERGLGLGNFNQPQQATTKELTPEVEKEQKALATKAKADIDSAIQDAYVASKGNWETAKPLLMGAFAKFNKDTNMSLEDIENASKQEFERIKKELNPDGYSSNRTGEVLNSLAEWHRQKMANR